MNKRRVILIAVLLAALVIVAGCALAWWSKANKGAQAATVPTEAKPQETKTEESGTGENKVEETKAGETKAEEMKPEETMQETESPAKEDTQETLPTPDAETAPTGEAQEETVVYTVGEEISTRVVTAFRFEDRESGWGFAVTTEGDEPMARLHYVENGEEKERSFPADEELWDRVLFLVKGGTLVRPAGENAIESALRWEGMTPDDEDLQFRLVPEKADALTELFEDMKTMETW